MRELLRSVARQRMIDAGYQNLNRKSSTNNAQHGGRSEVSSAFSRNWRKYIPAAD